MRGQTILILGGGIGDVVAANRLRYWARSPGADPGNDVVDLDST